MFTCTNTSDQHIKMKKSIGSSMKFWAIFISAQTPSKWKKMLSGVWPHSTPVTKANHPKIDLVTELCFPADITLHLETKNNHLWKTKWLEGKKSNIQISLNGQAYSRLLFFSHVWPVQGHFIFTLLSKHFYLQLWPLTSWEKQFAWESVKYKQHSSLIKMTIIKVWRGCGPRKHKQ